MAGNRMWCVWFCCLLNWLPAAIADSGVYHQLEYDFNEEQPAGATVGNVRNDARLGLDEFDPSVLSTVRFTHRQRNRFFVVDETSGDITSSRRIDREQLCPYVTVCEQVLEVAVTPLTLFQLVRVIINIVDVNDHDPIFPTKWLTLDVDETASVGSTFSLPEAEDADSQPLSVDGYHLVDGSLTFELETAGRGDGSHDVHVRLMRPVDREARDYYALMLVAVDGGMQPQRSTSMHIDVFIRDANDNSPTFDSPVYTAHVYEDVPLGTSVLRVSAYDPDEANNALVVYRCAVDDLSTSTDTFAINETSGEIVINGSIDFEAHRIHELTVVAEDRGPSPLPSFARIIIYIQDVNDNAPSIVVNTLTQSGRHAAVLENSRPGTFVSHLAVSDADAGRNAEVACVVDSQLFALDAIFDAEFKLVTKVVFDREDEAQHQVVISCRDSGVPRLTSTRQLVVRILDDNDNTPDLATEVFTVDLRENNHVGDVILVVNASDADEGRNAALAFHLEPLDSPSSLSDVVSIDRHTGVITALTSFDFESRQTYSFLLTVTDGGAVTHSRVATVVLNVLDVNDEVPTFFKSAYTLHVAENRRPGSTVGRVRASDADLSAQHRALFYSLEGHDSRAFRVSAQTGELFSRVALDRESMPVRRFTARVSNDPLFGAHSPLSIADIIVYVTDANDNFPVVRQPQRSNETFFLRDWVPAGHVITRVEATDADEADNARLTFAVINSASGSEQRKRPLFVIDDSKGDIVTTRGIQSDDAGRYTLLIAISDAGSPRRLTTTQIVILVNVTSTHHPGGGGRLVPDSSSMEDQQQFQTVALIVVVCSVLVVLKLVVVAVLCVRHNGALRVHDTAASSVAHKVKVTDQDENQANENIVSASVWKRFDGDHRNEAMPSSCSASSDNGLLVRHWYYSDTSPSASTCQQQATAGTGQLHRVRPHTGHTSLTMRPVLIKNSQKNGIEASDQHQSAAVRSFSYNAVTSLRNPISSLPAATITTLQRH